MPSGSAPRGRWLVGSRDTWQVFNLGNTHPEKVSKLISLLERGIGKRANITRAPITAGDVPMTFADVSHAREKLGYEPKVSLEQGLNQFLRWYSRYYNVPMAVAAGATSKRVKKPKKHGSRRRAQEHAG